MVGAGPAGLAAAAAAHRRGARCLLVERGAEHDARDRHDERAILEGVGGAGLFSDGKHSFYPAATALWRLSDTGRLAQAYAATRTLLLAQGVPAPAWPCGLAAAEERGTSHLTDDGGAEAKGWRRKRYPSIYATVDQRRRCVDTLRRQCGPDVWTEAQMVGLRRASGGGVPRFEVSVARGVQRSVIDTRNVVFATGRLSPPALASLLEPVGSAMAFRRLELGVRLEASAAAPLFHQLRDVDPKLTFADDRFSVLTFCTCREGEIVVGRAGTLRAVSGRADGPPTSRSSLGVLVRITDPVLAARIEPFLCASTQTFCVPLRALLASDEARAALGACFGDEGAGLVIAAVRRFVAAFPTLADDPDAVAHGPCIEGVGRYPAAHAAAGDELCIGQGLFVAGDASGLFRGLVAGLVSGAYVGLGPSLGPTSA